MFQKLKATRFSASVLKKMALVCAVALILAVAAGPILAFIVTKTPSLYSLFIADHIGDLVLSKTVEHPFKDGYVIPENLEFTFTVDVGTANANETFGDFTADDQGLITVTLKANEQVVISEIPLGTNVKVTETQPGTGFTPQQAVQEVTIQEHGNRLDFVNVYAPAPAPNDGLTVNGIKNLVGRDWKEGDSFTFLLERYDLEKNEWVSVGEQTVTYITEEIEDPENPGQMITQPKADFDQFDFTELIRTVSFDRAGEWPFRVTEKSGTAGGITYDKTVSQFDVSVGDMDMDGALEIQNVTASSLNNTVITKTDTGFTVDITFENRYAPTGSAEAFIQIQKLLEDLSGQGLSPAGFTFELYDDQGNLLQTSDATSAAGETTIKLVFEPTDAGKTFHYVLKETNGGRPGMSYDTTALEIEITVVDNLDGTVSAVVTGAEEPTNTCKAQFKNTYDPEDAKPAISGVKTLTGRVLKAGEFRFLLYKTDAFFGVEEGATPHVAAVNDGKGRFVFENLSFDKVGTYYFVVAEDSSAALGGVTYDGTRYQVTVRVSDDNGVLKADVQVANAAGEASELAFHNTYSAAAATVTLTGKTELNGAKLDGNMFTFLLHQADASYAPQGEAIDRITNLENGSFAFAALEFNAPGQYYYTVTEDHPDQDDRFTYDSSVYGVLITVSDDGEGQLTATTTITLAGERAEQICFINTYIPPEYETTVRIDVQKTVKNTGVGKIGPGGFEFVLENTETGAKITAKSNQKGEAAFSLVFTEQDVGKTFRYRLTETAGTKQGVTYSDRVYEIEIRVTLEGDQLIASVSCDGQPMDHLTAAFVNRYHGTANPPTGDTFKLWLVVALLGLSLAALVVMVILGIRRRKK